MTEKEIWATYILEYPCYKDEHYEAWCYGSDTPDLLAKLTVSGTKTATASAFPFYVYEKCELPKAEHAYKEGEGDRSLQYWRTVHAKAFTEELTEISMEFSEDILVVCEEFQVVFPVK